MKHTILGAGGSIGNALAYKLLEKGQQIRLVSRRGFTIEGTETVKADLTSFSETADSVKNSDIVYLCAGLQYNIDVWEDQWPKIMNNTINACKKAGAKLVFFDNVYMYGKVDGKMTESSPYNPCSKKGELRARLAKSLEDEIKNKNITAIIARAADVYGPYATTTSIPYILVIGPLLKGQRAHWMVNSRVPHSLSYTLDCANGLYMLVNDNSAFNQIWHMPTYNPAPDGITFIKLVADELSVPAKYTVLPKFMIRLIGYFNKPFSEIYEMTYQNEFPYLFDSSKFNDYFKYNPLSYKNGIAETIQFIKTGKI